MKRSMGDIVGLPRHDDYREDVAGVPLVARRLDVASFRHAIDDPMGSAETDAEWAAEFADFMDGETAFERGELPEPDPMFRERLHRRLWRTHVIANLRGGGETH